MSAGARVFSVEVLEELRLAVLSFGAEANKALDSVAGEIRRTEAWLEDQHSFWKAEIRQSEEELALAKEELARRKMMKVGGRPLDCTEQEKAWLRAKTALEHAQEKAQITRCWLRDLPDELTEYEGPARTLRHALEADLPRACALLEQKRAALEAYLRLAAPESPAAPARTETKNS